MNEIKKALTGITLVLAAMLVLSVGTASAEPEWNATYGGTGSDSGEEVRLTYDADNVHEGYIMVGYKAFPEKKLWLTKADLDGNMEWSHAYGNLSIMDWGKSVRQTPDRGYIVTGFTYQYSAGSWDAWLIKTNETGYEGPDNKSTWNVTFGGVEQDYSTAVLQTDDEGYIMAGYTRSYTLPDFNYEGWLIKTDSDGVEEWNKTYDYDTGMDAFESVEQISDGYIVAGWCKNETTGGRYNVWLVKTDSTGTELWNKTFGEIDVSDQGYSVKVSPTSDGYLIAAKTKSYGAGKYDSWLIKTDLNGDELWNKTYGGSEDDHAYAMDITSDGGYILTGDTKSYGAGSYDVWLVKVDSDGNEQCNRTFGGSGSDVANSIQQTPDGGFVMLGSTYSYGAGSRDLWLIKTDGPCCLGTCYENDDCTGAATENIPCSECNFSEGHGWSNYEFESPCAAGVTVPRRCYNATTGGCPTCCNDADDDNDGHVDYPADSGCACCLDPTEIEDGCPAPCVSELATVAMVGLGLAGLIGCIRLRKD